MIDVATGTGAYVSTLVDGLASWTEIVGIDTDPAHADAFAETFADAHTIRFEVMDALRPQYPPESFDTASVSNSLHHFARPSALLRRMLDLVRVGGTLIVSEMYRDRQSATQLTHVALHHWCAEVDQLQGVVHRPTYARRQLLRFIEGLELKEMRSTEIADTSSDPKDPATIQAVDGVIDRYLDKADGHPELVRAGEAVRHRLQTVGIHGATMLLVTGRKRPS